MNEKFPQIPKAQPGEMVIIPLGGTQDIGYNATLYGTRNKNGETDYILVDCGMGLGDNAKKNTNGMEKEYPNFSVLHALGNRLKGCVITHAHEDHIGAVTAYWPELKCPIYAPNYAYAVLDGRFRSRNIRDTITMYPFTPGQNLNVAGINIETIPVTHSTPDSTALALHGPAGVVVHSGDWKIDDYVGLGVGTNKKHLERIGQEGVRLFVNESTNSAKPGLATSERKALQGLDKIISEADGPVIIATFGSNFTRVAGAHYIANKYGKKLGVLGGSLDKAISAGRSAGYVEDPDSFLNAQDLADYPLDKQVLVVTGSQGEKEKTGIRRILAGDVENFTVNGKTKVVFASGMIPGNEPAIKELQDDFKRLGAQIITNYDPDICVHATGHAGEEDHKIMLNLLKPREMLAVHGTPDMRQTLNELGKKSGINDVIVTQGDGCPVAITKNSTRVLEPIPMEKWGGNEYYAWPVTEENSEKCKNMEEERRRRQEEKTDKPWKPFNRIYYPSVPSGPRKNYIANSPQRNAPRGTPRLTNVEHPSIIMRKEMEAQNDSYQENRFTETPRTAPRRAIRPETPQRAPVKQNQKNIIQLKPSPLRENRAEKQTLPPKREENHPQPQRKAIPKQKYQRGGAR